MKSKSIFFLLYVFYICLCLHMTTHRECWEILRLCAWQMHLTVPYIVLYFFVIIPTLFVLVLVICLKVSRLLVDFRKNADCQLCCSVTFRGIIHTILHMGICSFLFQLSYITSLGHIVSWMCLLSCMLQDCIAIALFLYSIWSYHQISISILSLSAETENSALDAVNIWPPCIILF